ncbi:ATP-dependent RNA helicase RhlE [uncultured Alphaproteobacteria bacterium]|uniref:ATP-dependent RNA helicase RhlE n=1 Tax=uncultured Alphaproteobacteria bacterium TaxID=91750 RepID=A0A212KH79_9PROT|nr:ATP-dependent RNA helicase RhlE [uncultured Alphaproteobacteria bacterium]
MTFDAFALHPLVLKAVAACGLTEPTPVQAEAIPHVLAGRDVLATAATGTGKTAAYLLPVLSAIAAQPVRRHPGAPTVLILTPTRELAGQVGRSVRDFGKFANVQSVEIVGGMPYREQLRRLARPVDVAVATPGRLLDHVRANRLDLSRIDTLILDEADRMLDMGFAEDVAAIGAACPAERRTLLFTATLDRAMETLARALLRDPARVAIATTESKPDIVQALFHADDLAHKKALLAHHVSRPEVGKAIVFVATKRDADDLARELAEAGHAVAALHGDLSQGQRNHTLKRLHDGRLRLLVATDVAARGIDVRDISHVINFDLPRVAEDYVHRIGRTGRAGATGTAISFAGRDDMGLVIRIERFTHTPLPVMVVPGLEPKLPPRRAPSRPGPKRPGNGGFRKDGPRGEGGFRKEGARKDGGFRKDGPRPGKRDAAGRRPSRGDAGRKRA